jgi:hypothetical protein
MSVNMPSLATICSLLVSENLSASIVSYSSPKVV